MEALCELLVNKKDYFVINDIRQLTNLNTVGPKWHLSPRYLSLKWKLIDLSWSWLASSAGLTVMVTSRSVVNGEISSSGQKLFFKKWTNPGLLYCLFSVFSSKHHYNFYSRNMWKMSIHYTVPGFEPTTFGNESPPITTCPWTIVVCGFLFYDTNCLFLMTNY